MSGMLFNRNPLRVGEINGRRLVLVDDVMTSRLHFLPQPGAENGVCPDYCFCQNLRPKINKSLTG
jgi:hypothetical protein